jgi:hypothetical protein
VPRPASVKEEQVLRKRARKCRGNMSRFEVARAGPWQLELLGVELQWLIASVRGTTSVKDSHDPPEDLNSC